MKTMRRIFAIPLILSLVSCVTTGGPGSVQFNGCASAGTEPGCLMLRSGGVTYDVTLASPRPSINMGMIGNGTILTGPTTCQEGVALTGIHWRPSRRHCPSAAILRRDEQAA